MAAPTIDEVQFPTDISRGAVGGAGFATIVVVGSSGSEQRQGQWSQPRYEWDVSHALRDVAQATVLIAFFLARQGRLRGFRFKDWSDFAATNENLYPSGGPKTLGQSTAQIVKTYTSLVSYVRILYKAVSSPAATFRKNAAPITPASFDVNTGVVTWTALNSKAITGITQAASAVITVGAAHGFAVNDLVHITGVVGMTQINDLVGTVTATGASTITVNINSTTFSAYTSGGTAAKYAVVGDTFDWTGQFDVPARFDIDQMRLTQEDVEIRSWGDIPIVEVRA